MKVYHQNVFEQWPFEDESIQAIITSPPFYSLRKYDIPDIIIGGNPECEHEWDKENKTLIGNISNKSTLAGYTSENVQIRSKLNGNYQQGFCQLCNAWQGQYGLEPTYQLFIDHTLLWAKEAWRVLRKDGIFFLNLGDSWNGGNRGAGMQTEQWSEKQKSNTGTMSWNVPLKEKNIPSKCKLLIPHRVAIGLIEQGWILRNDIVWYKPNAMPESVRDRFSKKFEYIFMLTKTGKYYFDIGAVALPSITYETDKRCSALEQARMLGYKTKLQYKGKSERTSTFLASRPVCNPGDVWIFNTQPSPEKHYAMWPQKLVERMILCSTKVGDIVLDPFCGSGTTLRVADELNRVAYGIDLGYQDIQERRLSNIQKALL